MRRVKSVIAGVPGWWWGVALVGAGCNSDFRIRDRGDEADANRAALLVDPPELVFPPSTSLDEVVEVLTVTNLGEATLIIDELALIEETDGTLGSYTFQPSVEIPHSIQPREQFTIEVTFQPKAGGRLPAELMIYSTDDEEPELPVPIRGVGQMPRVVIEPNPVEFDDPIIPCSEQETVLVRNLGPEPAVITDIFLDGQGSEMLSFVVDPPQPLTLNENGQHLLSVSLDPWRKMRVTGSLAVESNDPRGTVRAPVLAETRFVREVTDSFTVPTRFPVDIAIGIDQSGSMQDRRANLRSQFEVFIQQLEDATLDWRVGVVTHDRGSSLRGCFNGGSSGAITNLPGWQTTLRNALFPVTSVGVDDRLTEGLLAAVSLALQKSGPGQCNAGFGQGRNPMNPPPLHVIVASDERDQSEFDPIGSWFSPSRNIPEGASAKARMFVDDYRAWAGPNADVKVHGVVDVAGRADLAIPGCSGVRPGPAGYREAIQDTGGIMMDICFQPDWASAFASITQDVIRGAQALPLSDANPWPDSISVWVDGTREDDGWEYDEDLNAVVFDDPPRGRDVDVIYGVAGRCR